MIKVGLDVHESILALPPTESRVLVERAADAGLDYLVVGDHLSFQGGRGFDGLIAAAFALAAHPTLPVVVSVYQLALRHPLAVARQLASLAQAAPGRLLVGVGAGGEDRLEIANAGVEPNTRGRRLDEAMRVLRLLATGQPVDFEGTFFTLREALVLPVPSPPIPILVGGRSPAALKRAAELSDGWLPIFVSPRRFREAVAQIGPMAVPPKLCVWCGLDGDRTSAMRRLAGTIEGLYSLPYDQFRNLTCAGPPEEAAQFLAPYVEAGCREFSLCAVGSTNEAVIELAAEVRRLLSASLAPSRS